jgi:arylsulfatase A-like enzyme
MFRSVPFPAPPNYSDELDPYGDAWSDIEKSPGLIEEWMRVYYAMTSSLDWNVGRILHALDELGIAGETIVVFTSDHGEMFGAQGRMKKNIFYDEAARVPFVVRQPWRIPAGLVSDACLSTPDIMPTLLSLAGLPVPEGVEGMDLGHLALGREGPEPECAFLMNTGACATWENGHEWRALRTRRHTYAVFREPRKELLFDNTADPFQMKNLAGGAEHGLLLEELRGRLKEQMAALKDEFRPSTWYRDHWIEDRVIRCTATLRTEPGGR